MRIIADTHVHIYPDYDLGRFFASALQNLARLAEATPALCLTERHDCHFFETLATGALDLSAHGLTPEAPATGPVLRWLTREQQPLLLVAGHQVVTAERIEVLGLAMREKVADGLSLPETLGAIRGAEGLPVLSWAPGKWMGARGQMIAQAIEDDASGNLAVGDTSLRPLGWGEPAAMRMARERGLPVLAGSDPLPFAGEERHAGCYATLWEDVSEPAFPACLRKSGKTVGRRGSPFTVATRWLRNQRVRTRS